MAPGSKLTGIKFMSGHGVEGNCLRGFESVDEGFVTILSSMRFDLLLQRSRDQYLSLVPRRLTPLAPVNVRAGMIEHKRMTR